ncbi:hypothetical protein [Pontiella desulfatans]|nr:hypothetical protein [Pontiella desulfatans]
MVRTLRRHNDFRVEVLNGQCIKAVLAIVQSPGKQFCRLAEVTR